MAVSSKHMNTLLTAGHCVREPDRHYWCCLRVCRSAETGGSVVAEEAFPVCVVAVHRHRPDLAVLVAPSHRFQNAPRLLPSNRLPWQSRPTDWYADATVFYCPVEADHHTDADYDDILRCNVDCGINIYTGTTHHFFLSEAFCRGSSGGGVFLGNDLIGILIKNTTHGPFEMVNAMLCASAEAGVDDSSDAKARDMIDIAPAKDTVDVVSIASGATNFPMTRNVAVIPSALYVCVGGDRISLQDFLDSDFTRPPPEKGEKPHGLAAKA
jgi:hypothetical protein